MVGAGLLINLLAPPPSPPQKKEESLPRPKLEQTRKFFSPEGKMISNDNRNRSQRDAMIDTMNKSQVRRMGKLVDFFPHQITRKDYKVAVKKSRICKGNNRK